MTSIKMKIKISFIFYIFFAFFIVQSFSQCIDYFDAIDHSNKREVACPLVKNDLYKRTSNQGGAKLQLVGFECNNATDKVCEDVRNTFDVMSDLFSETFVLKEPVLVHLNFTDLCVITPERCNITGDFITIGSAHSARDILMLDEDGITRFYPQSLVKQFQFESHPEFSPIDVIMTFNSVIEWYFPSDIGKREIEERELDLLYTMLHEMVHSLGFKTNWNSWFVVEGEEQRVVTPLPTLRNNGTIFQGFKEAAFDRCIKIIDSNDKKLTKYTIKLNEFAEVGTVFENSTDFIYRFIDSDEASIGEFVNNLTTTPETLYQDCAGEDAILETSLDPFQSGLNMNHFQQPLINSTDFLMTTIQVRGITLDELIENTGSKGPIGPKTQAIMECIGLATINNPNPYRPQLAS